MNLNNYYYYTNLEGGFLKIPSFLLYNLWDKKKMLTLVADNTSRSVVTQDYRGFTCEDEYRIACFKPDGNPHNLDAFYLKLLKSVHHEWFNELFEYWKSQEFISILQQVGKLRTTQEILPPKDQQFDFLKDRISITVIPDSVTTNSGEIWKPFVEKLRRIQQQDLINRKKFDV